MLRYMLDTDIASYVMKGSNTAVLSQLQHVAIDDVCISAITKSELLYGVEISPRKQADRNRIDIFLQHVQVLDYPGEAAVDYVKFALTSRHGERSSEPTTF